MHAVVRPDGDDWLTVSWAELDVVVREVGAGLVALGVEAEDRVAIASSTRYEWALADLAIMVSGGATTTIYPTTIADDVAFILADSGAKVVFAENAEQLDKLRSIRSQIPGVSRVVVFDGQSDDDAWTLSLDDVRQLGREYLAGDPGAIDARIDRIQPDQLATIIYTSGTTGRPKGVRLRHSAWTYEAAATESINILAEDDLQYLWLPLAHVFGKVLLTLPLQIGFTTAIDGRIDKIVDNLAVVTPDLHGGGAAHLREGLRPHPDDDGRRGRPEAQALRVGRRRGPRGQRAARAGQEPLGDARPKYAISDKLIGTKIRDRFGGRIRFFISGSAALNQDVARWFDAMGMQIAEGYGLTETSAASFVNRTKAYRYGSVGWALPGTEVRIAEDGEVLLRGPGVMEGYHNNPDATAEALDAEGWLHTGDIGEQDDRASCGSPTARRTCSRRAAASTSRRRSSSRRSRGCAPTPASSSSTAPTATSSPRSSPSTRTRSRAGRRSTAWRARPTRRSSPPTPAGRWCRATSTSSTPASTAGRRSRSSRSSRATSPSRTAS